MPQGQGQAGADLGREPPGPANYPRQIAPINRSKPLRPTVSRSYDQPADASDVIKKRSKDWVPAAITPHLRLESPVSGASEINGAQGGD